MLYHSMMIDTLKKKRRAFGDKVYTNFRGLNVPEADIECELFYIHFY